MKGIQFVGIGYSDDKKLIKKKLGRLKIAKNKPSVLLYHVPLGMEHAKKKGIDLQLSGHTHKGQVFPFNYLVMIEFRYLAGLYDIDGMKLYVSPGTGTWGPPMRLGSRNEITVLKLRKA